MDYFKEFGLKKSFFIDFEQLELAYIDQQLKCHPDKFINADADSRQRSFDKTVSINKAYNALKSDLARALYLLELEGVLLNDEENLVDFPELLRAVFEERESLDSANSLEELQDLYQRSKKDLELYKREFSESYEERKFSNASVLYKKMLYKDKVIAEIKTKLNKLELVK